MYQWKAHLTAPYKAIHETELFDIPDSQPVRCSTWINYNNVNMPKRVPMLLPFREFAHWSRHLKCFVFFFFNRSINWLFWENANVQNEPCFTYFGIWMIVPETEAGICSSLQQDEELCRMNLVFCSHKQGYKCFREDSKRKDTFSIFASVFQLDALKSFNNHE